MPAVRSTVAKARTRVHRRCALTLTLTVLSFGAPPPAWHRCLFRPSANYPASQSIEEQQVTMCVTTRNPLVPTPKHISFVIHNMPSLLFSFFSDHAPDEHRRYLATPTCISLSNDFNLLRERASTSAHTTIVPLYAVEGIPTARLPDRLWSSDCSVP